MTESKTLKEDYIISQLYLQAPFVAKNILSLQAQMMGLYPATDANDLTEWQQGNAVPPIEGADFSEWQKELGAHALPHGLQTFPIQQTGFEKDFTLSLSEKNCARYAAKIEGPLAKIAKELDATIAKEYPDIAAEMKEKDVTGEELCDYLTWAHFNAVPLQGDKKRQDAYANLGRETCPKAYYAPVTQEVQKVNAAEGNLVASGFLSVLLDRVNYAVTKTNATEDQDLPLALTNYQALTSDILLTIAGQSLDLPSKETEAQLPASSSLIFEIWNDQTVHGYLNDVEFVPAGCKKDQPCTADLFTTEIAARITYDTKPKTAETAMAAANEALQDACADTTREEDRAIQQ